MSISNKDERSLLSHEEYETVKSAHHPAIYALDEDELRNLAIRLEGYRDKARTFARQKRLEVKGTADARGKSFPGTAAQPQRRKQVFVQALKRVKKASARLHHLDAKAANTSLSADGQPLAFVSMSTLHRRGSS